MLSSAARSATAILERPGLAGFKIVTDVIAFRLRNLEMANLAGAASIALVLHLPWFEVLYRTAFAFVLNAFVYLNNDYLDAADDLKSASRNTEKTRFLLEHRDAALAAQWGLLALLVAAALAFDAELLVALVLGGGSCVWYSRQLKRVPFVDVVAMAVWGLAMPLCGVPLGSALGWCLTLQLGLFAAVYETIQVMRDAGGDAAAGIRTTGVVLGRERTRLLSRALMLLACVFAALVLHPLTALLAAGALLVPLDHGDMERRWTRVKAVYGAAWLFTCAWIFFTGRSAGLLWSIAATTAAP
jgi:4-hydroxybenzoate polyprenyltransferase